MAVVSVVDLLETGRTALRAGDWDRARTAFTDAADRGGGAPAFEGLGMAAWWVDDGDVMFSALEDAYRLYRASADPHGAVRAATTLATSSVLFRGEWAVAQGWFGRAHRLIDGLDASPEHVRLAISEGLMQFVVLHDVGRAAELAREAVVLARDQDSVGLELESLALEGFALVSQGAIDDGLRLLDESTAGALAGDIDGLSAMWLTYCFMLWACELARDYDRAGQWCERVMAFTERLHMAYPFAVCRAHYGTVLTWRGAWADAERELERAGETMRTGRPPSAGEAWARLGELRRRQGRRAEAHELFEQSPFTMLARIGAAELKLDEGAAPAALESAKRLLQSLRPDDTVARSAVLEVIVRAAAACGRIDEGREWLAQLDACASRVGNDPVCAGAARGRGVLHLAASEWADAAASLEEAVARFDRSGGVFEASCARLDLAHALDGCGDTDGARREQDHAFRELRALGVDVSYPTQAPIVPAGSPEALSVALTERELEVLRLVADGLSNKRIAAELHISDHTVKRHVANILTKTGLPTRAAVAAYAARAGM
jgi:DNA-binding CsgD family transcriptional regulator